MPLRSPHVIRRKPYTKKVPVVKFALVAFKDDLTCSVFPVGELKGPKSLVPGATVRVMIPGGLKKGSVVTISEYEQSLKMQVPVFDVCGFFGLPLKKHSVRGSKGKINLAVKMASDIVTSTPLNSNQSNRPLISSNPPSPIKHRNDTVIPDQGADASHYLPYLKNKSSLTCDSSFTESQYSKTSPTIVCRSLVFPKVLTEESAVPEYSGIENTSASTNQVSIIPESMLDDMSIPLIEVTYAVSGFFDCNLQSSTENNSFICNQFKNEGLTQAIADEQHIQNKLVSVVLPSYNIPEPVYNIYNYNINGITKSSLSDEEVSRMIHDIKPTPTSRNGPFLQEELYLTGTQPHQSPQHQILEESHETEKDTLIRCDLQMTPMEMFQGLKMKCDHPLRIDLSEINTDILYYIKSISSTPELFARNMMYRIFNLMELQVSTVYGRGYSNGIRNVSLNAQKVKAIRKLARVLYNDIKFSWRNCVLWMDKSIKYVRKFVHFSCHMESPHN